MATSETQNFDARRRVAPLQRNSRVVRERDGRIFAGQIFLLICGAALACGFVYAAGQKFAAVRYGYACEALRQEQERLLSERRRLTLEMDKTASPLRLEKAAKINGLDAASVMQIRAAKANTAQIVKVVGAKQRDTTRSNGVVKPSSAAQPSVASKSYDVVKTSRTSGGLAARR